MAIKLGESKNIIVGASVVWIGTAAAVKPAVVAGTSYNATLSALNGVGWRNAGFTQEGVEFSNEPEFTGVQVDQLLDDAKQVKTGISNSINTTFAEATFENLLVVWGQSDGTLTTTSGVSTLNIVSGELGEAPQERQLIVVGNGREGAAGYNERAYHFKRAISVESSSFAQRRSEATVFPVSFRLLPDDNGSYGTFIESARAW